MIFDAAAIRYFAISPTATQAKIGSKNQASAIDNDSH